MYNIDGPARLRSVDSGLQNQYVSIITTGPNMRTIEKKCLQCYKVIIARLADHKRGRANFCSLSCSAAYGNMHRKKPAPNCKCAQCHGEFYRNSSKQKNSKSGLHFCNRICKEKAQRIGGIKAIQPDHYGTGGSRNYYRALALRHYPHECNRCSYSRCLSVIEVHHKDRDRSNNQLENLELLCRNCHGEEHHLDDRQ